MRIIHLNCRLSSITSAPSINLLFFSLFFYLLLLSKSSAYHQGQTQILPRTILSGTSRRVLASYTHLASSRLVNSGTAARTVASSRKILFVFPHRLLSFSTLTRNMATTSVDSTANTNADVAPIVLDRKAFDTEVTHLALKVKPNLCSHYLVAWKPFLFKRPKFKCIYNTADNEYRLLILQEQYQDESLSFAPEALRNEHFAKGDGFEKYTLRIAYEHLTAEEVLRKVLPANITEIPCSYEQAGHIAHMNLRDEVLPYKHIVGQVIVDKNPNIRTVVNKIGQIETEFRTFPLEVVAGDDDMIVTLKESNSLFTFNFAEVYWNSRYNYFF